MAISVHVVCEFAWVLSRRYDTPRGEIAVAIRRLIETHNVVVDRPAIAAGLSVLDAGGDFADGVISHDGRWLGGETFVSFDRKAVKLVGAQGTATLMLQWDDALWPERPGGEPSKPTHIPSTERSRFAGARSAR